MTVPEETPAAPEEPPVAAAVSEPEPPPAAEAEHAVEAEAEQPPTAEAEQPPTAEAEQPAVGPRIIGRDLPPRPAPPLPAPYRPPPKPKRRRPTAAEKHRRVFFARLTEMRAGPVRGAKAPAPDQPPVAEQAPETVEAQAPGDLADAPVVDAPVDAAPAGGAALAVEDADVGAPTADDPEPAGGEARAAEDDVPAAEAAETDESDETAASDEAAAPDESAAPEAPAESSQQRTAREQARLVAAIERVGGPDVIRQALQPKRDDAGKPLKWAAVCCEAAQGNKPGDPIFTAWLRLAATPVREIKGKVPDDRPPARGGGGSRGSGPGNGGPRGGGQRRDERGGRGGRGRDNEGRASREDMAKHAYGGRVGAKIVIPGFELSDDED